MAVKNDVIQYIKQRYNITPDHPWPKYPEHSVFRHSDNRKWFALMMSVAGNRVGIDGDDMVDIINLKCESALMGALLHSRGYRPAYHMSKANWITIILDGSVGADEICNLVTLSYNLTAMKKKRK